MFPAGSRNVATMRFPSPYGARTTSPAMVNDPPDDLVDTVDIDEEDQTGLTRNGLVAHPRATDVAAGVVEGGPVAVVVANGPPEDGLIEASSLVHIDRGDVQVRDPAGPFQERLDARILAAFRLVASPPISVAG